MTMNCDVLIALALNDEERDFVKRLINAMFIENPSENDIDALQAVAYLALAVINQLPKTTRDMAIKKCESECVKLTGQPFHSWKLNVAVLVSGSSEALRSYGIDPSVCR